MRKFIYFLIIANLYSCTTVEEVFGVYVKQPSENIIDSIFLTEAEQGIINSYTKSYKFTQRIYDKSKKKLLFENSQIWYLSNGGIYLNALYLGDDSPPVDSMPEMYFRRGLISFSTQFYGDDIIVDEVSYYIKIE